MEENFECKTCDNTEYIQIQTDPDNTEKKRCPDCNPKDEELLENNLD